MGRDRPDQNLREGAKPTTHVGCIQIGRAGWDDAAETDAAGERES